MPAEYASVVVPRFLIAEHAPGLAGGQSPVRRCARMQCLTEFAEAWDSPAAPEYGLVSGGYRTDTWGNSKYFVRSTAPFPGHIHVPFNAALNLDKPNAAARKFCREDYENCQMLTVDLAAGIGIRHSILPQHADLSFANWPSHEGGVGLFEVLEE